MKYTETMWAIHGVHGLYIGTWLTRKEAIATHVKELYGAPNGKADNSIKEAWWRCRNKGDRAVKVEITYTV